MDRLKKYISLNYRGTLKSDNINDTMKLNRFLANPLNVLLFIIVMDILAIFVFSFVINALSHFGDMIKDPVNMKNYINWTLIFPSITGRSYLTKMCYAFFLFLLIVIDIKQAYTLRVSYSGEDINKGTAGTSRWTTINEAIDEYKEIEMNPSTYTLEDAKEGIDYEVNRNGDFIPINKELPEEGGSYIDKIVLDQETVKKKVKTPNWYLGAGGVPVIRWRDKLYIDSQLTNNLFLGTTRSGKGEMFVFPLIDLLSRAYAMANRPSMIIFDPKLELYKGSKHTLEARGYITRLLNLDNPKKSAGYNPLSIIAEFYADGKRDEAQQLAKSFAFSIFNSDRNQEAIWRNTSTDLFTALIIAVVSDCIRDDDKLNSERRKRLKVGKEIFEDIDDKEEARKVFYNALKNLPESEDILSGDKIDFAIPPEYEFEPIYPNRKNINCFSVINFFRELCDVNSESIGQDPEAGAKKAETALDDYFNNRPPLDFAAGLYASIKSAGDRTKGSIYVNMQSALTIFSMDSIARMTAESNINFKEIGFGKKPVAIFLGLPTEDKSNHFLALNFVTQVFQYLFKVAKAGNGKLERNVRFILDEFGNMPVLDNFGGMVTNCLGVGFSFDIFIQSYNQLHTNYEMEMDTIKDNFANQFYIMALGNETANEFSEQLGNKTVIELQRTGTRFGRNKTFMESSKERPLLFPKELKEFRQGEYAMIRGAKRTDLAGAGIKHYPILGEYMDNISFVKKLQIRSMVKKRRKADGAMRNRDTGEPLSYRQELNYELSEAARRSGTAFLFRYQYATDDFPNPNEIYLDQICIESRERVNYTEYVYDPNIALGKKENAHSGAKKKVLSELSDYYSLETVLYACFGDNYEDELGLNANTNVEQAMTIISAACDREGIKEKMAAQMKSILMRG